MRRWIVSVVGCAAVVVVACSGKSVPTIEANTDPPAPASTAPTAAHDSGAAPTAPDTPSARAVSTPPSDAAAPVPAGCSPDQGVEACFDCCAAKNPGGAEVLDKAWLACVCAPKTCKAACKGSLCAPTPKDPKEGDDCEECLTDAVQCEDQATAACAKNKACSGFEACLAATKCDQAVDRKP